MIPLEHFVFLPCHKKPCKAVKMVNKRLIVNVRFYLLYCVSPSLTELTFRNLPLSVLGLSGFKVVGFSVPCVTAVTGTVTFRVVQVTTTFSVVVASATPLAVGSIFF